jgi:VWFA-related protein
LCCRQSIVLGELMLNRFLIAASIFTCVLVLLAVPAGAQTATAAPSQKQPTFTLRTTARIVLTDITVTDAKGNSIRGLKQSDFHIFDNGKPQSILSFTEHTTTPVAAMPQTSVAPGVFSNSFLDHLPPVLNIVLIDTTNLEIVDQMYLRYKLDQFIKQLPPGEPLAIYLNTGPHSLLLQNFTSDHTLLLNAIHEAIPRFPPTGREYYSDLSALYKVAVNFGEYPGRKNILWFTGGSTLFLNDDPRTLGGLPQEDPAAGRAIYDILQTGRIAVYPVDARGLQVVFGEANFINLASQHGLMNDAAQATGGHAYYDNNGLDLIAEHWLRDSGDFYTLSYSPSDFAMNNKWHKVRIQLNHNGPKYFLSYRRGYFADGSITGKRPSGKWRTRLLANGGTIKLRDQQRKPIIFQVEIKPASEISSGPIVAGVSPSARPKRGTIPYVIHYELPASSFATNVVDGKTEIVFGVGVIAFKGDGSKDAGLASRVTLTVNPSKLRENPDFKIPVDQRINLHKGQSYLYLAAWDMNSRRLGTLQVPLRVIAPETAR